MIKRILQAVCENLPSIIGWKLHVFWCRCNVSTRFPQSWISIVGFLYVTSRVQASHCPACFVIDASQSPIVKDPFPNLARQEDPETSTSLQLSRRCNKHAGLYRLACSCTPSATYHWLISICCHPGGSACRLLLGNAHCWQTLSCKNNAAEFHLCSMSSSATLSIASKTQQVNIAQFLVSLGSAVPSPCLEVSSFRFEVWGEKLFKVDSPEEINAFFSIYYPLRPPLSALIDPPLPTIRIFNGLVSKSAETWLVSPPWPT